MPQEPSIDGLLSGIGTAAQTVEEKRTEAEIANDAVGEAVSLLGLKRNQTLTAVRRACENAGIRFVNLDELATANAARETALREKSELEAANRRLTQERDAVQEQVEHLTAQVNVLQAQLQQPAENAQPANAQPQGGFGARIRGYW